MLRLSKDLGYTLLDLSERITLSEIQIWMAFYDLESEELEKAKKRRR